MFNGTLEFASNPSDLFAVITIRSSVIVANQVTWKLLPGVKVDWDQSYASQYPMFAFDQSVIVWSNAEITHGRAQRLINVAFLCDQSDMTVYRVDTSKRTQANLSPFLYVDSKITLSENVGPIYEITLNDNATLSAFNNDPALAVGTYFTVGTTITTPVTFPTPGVQSVVIGPVGGMTANILNSNYMGGVWLRDGTSNGQSLCDITFTNSWLLLFPSWSAQSTYQNPVNGLVPYATTPITKTITQGLGQITVRLTNSIVYLWNAYFGGGLTHRITNSVIGEMTCESPNTVCHAQNVTLDGTGGGLNAQDTTRWHYSTGSVAAVFTASGSSVSTFTGVVFRPNAAKAALYLQANGQSVAVLQDSSITVTVASNPAVGYQLLSTDNGVIISARFFGAPFAFSYADGVAHNKSYAPTVYPNGTCVDAPAAPIDIDTFVYPGGSGSTVSVTAYDDAGGVEVVYTAIAPHAGGSGAVANWLPARSGWYHLVLIQTASGTTHKAEVSRWVQWTRCPSVAVPSSSTGGGGGGLVGSSTGLSTGTRASASGGGAALAIVFAVVCAAVDGARFA